MLRTGARRAPGQQATFEQGDQVLGDQRDDGDDEHPGEDAVRVETALRWSDDQADAVLGAEHLADEGADDGEAEGGVQAGDDPGQRRGHGDVADDLQR